MKILFVATEVGETNGGKGRYALEIMRRIVPQLNSMGHKVTVLMPRDAPSKVFEPHSTIVRLPVAKNTSLWRAIWEEVYLPLHAAFVDVVVVMNGMFPVGPLLAKRKIVVLHDIHPLQHLADPANYPCQYTRKSLIRVGYEMRKAIRKADQMVVVSETAAEEIHGFLHVPLGSMVVVPNAVDPVPFHRQDPARLEELRTRYRLPQAFYLFIGYPDASEGNKKNLHRIVEAYSRAQDEGGHLLPVVIAGGERAGGRREPEIVDVGGPTCRGKFIYLGFMPDQDFPALYSAAHALLFPSLHEGFGIPPLEAMACGTPVIAADRPAIPEVVGDAALMIDPLSTESLLDAIHQVNDPAVRQGLITKGFARARLFSWERSAEIMLPLIVGEAPKPGTEVPSEKVGSR